MFTPQPGAPTFENGVTMPAIKYILPKQAPWMVTIDGNIYPVPSEVARLLLHLAKAPKRVANKEKKAKSGSKSAK